MGYDPVADSPKGMKKRNDAETAAFYCPHGVKVRGRGVTATGAALDSGNEMQLEVKFLVAEKGRMAQKWKKVQVGLARELSNADCSSTPSWKWKLSEASCSDKTSDFLRRLPEWAPAPAAKGVAVKKATRKYSVGSGTGSPVSVEVSHLQVATAGTNRIADEGLEAKKQTPWHTVCVEGSEPKHIYATVGAMFFAAAEKEWTLEDLQQKFAPQGEGAKAADADRFIIGGYPSLVARILAAQPCGRGEYDD
eukprot:g12592.t1